MKRIILCMLLFIITLGFSGCDNGSDSQSCHKCGGDGVIDCYRCDGLGKYYNNPLHSWYKCGICMGRGYLYCDNCDN